MSEFRFKPIGVVEVGFPRPGEPGHDAYRSRYEFVGTVRVFDEYADALHGLDEYSHVILVYVFHEVTEYSLRVRLRGTNKEVGVFATRYPIRPNPIGISVLELVELKPPRLKLRGLDAWTGTPVLDIKPYDYYDIVKRPRVPKEFEEEWSRSYEEKGYGTLVPWMGPC